MSMNFNQIKTIVGVDLTANSTLSITSISTKPVGSHSEEGIAVDFPLVAYFCNPKNELYDPGALQNGDVLEVCVEVDESYSRRRLQAGEGGVYVKDVLQFRISQPGGQATPSQAIKDGQPDYFTDKKCNDLLDGRCNIKTQVLSKYFTKVTLPKPLLLDGLALLTFGNPNSRRLRSVPIRAALTTHGDRGLHEQDIVAGENPFSLAVSLLPDEDLDTNNAIAVVSGVKSTSSDGATRATLGVLIVIALFLFAIFCALIYMACFSKRRQYSVEEHEMLLRYVAKNKGINPICESGTVNTKDEKERFHEFDLRIPRKTADIFENEPTRGVGRTRSFDQHTFGSNHASSGYDTDSTYQSSELDMPSLAPPRSGAATPDSRGCARSRSLDSAMAATIRNSTSMSGLPVDVNHRPRRASRNPHAHNV